MVAIGHFYSGCGHDVESALVGVGVGICSGCLLLSDFLLSFWVKAVMCTASDKDPAAGMDPEVRVIAV